MKNRRNAVVINLGMTALPEGQDVVALPVYWDKSQLTTQEKPAFAGWAYTTRDRLKEWTVLKRKWKRVALFWIQIAVENWNGCVSGGAK